MVIVESDELDIQLKKYKLDSLLLLIAEETRKMYRDGKWSQTVHWARKIGGYTQTFDQLMPIWGLAELSHRAIKNSNDHRSQEPKIEDLYRLNNLLAKVSDQEASKKSSKKITDQTRK